MAPDLYAAVPVTDHQAAPAWYERLFGSPPVCAAGGTEAVLRGPEGDGIRFGGAPL
jgi:hypothetical protein